MPMTPFSAADLHLHRKITQVHAFPTQEPVVFVVRSPDRDKDAYASHLWCLRDGQAEPLQLTFGAAHDTSPRLCPDGRRLAFLSDRDGGPTRPFVLDLAGGGEARPVGQFGQAVSALRWTADGSALLVSMQVPVDPDRHGARSPQPPGPRGPKSPEVAWKLPYKMDGMGYLLAGEVHLFRVDVGSGKCSRLTDGDFRVFGFDAAPDGRSIAYVRSRQGRFTHTTDLWLCSPGGQDHRQATQRLASVMAPAWSPDAQRIALLGAEEESDARSGLWLLDVATGGLARVGTPDFEVAPGTDLHWSGDGEHLFVAQAHRGRHRVVRVHVADGRIEPLVTGDRQLGGFACSRSRLAYAVDSPVQPSELWCCDSEGGRERQATDFNAWWRERVPIACESRSFQVPDGHGGTETIHGWLLRADDGRDGPRPLLDDAHGGPASYALLDYDTNVFWQVLCSRGWAVLALDAVGSASYGRAFCDRLSGHWGERDLPQHLAAIRQLQHEGVCDDRIAISGKSYGGFLSSWAVGHTHAFRAAVVMAPVGNIETHYGTSDGGYYAAPTYIGRKQSFDREKARQLSPAVDREVASAAAVPAGQGGRALPHGPGR